ncbi:MAG: TonB-dependent receptor domain-containing protein [Terriglobales bacterium]
MTPTIATVLRFAAVLTIVLLLTQISWAQGAVTSGTVTGDVTDASGAVLPGAKVVARNQGTGLKREAVSDGSGHFVLSQLPAGRYDISVTAPGFKESVVRDFQLNVDAMANLKFALALGSVEQKVDVNAESAQIAVELSKTEVSNVIQEIQVRELPINQRSFTALVTQQPGLVTMTNTGGNVNQAPITVTFAQGSQISANGMASRSMAYLVDGVNINNSGFGAPGTAAGGDVPGVEGIQEFKVLSQNYSAAYGGSAGAVVSFATRGGTNVFHGSAYEFLRNDVLDAREFFNRPPFAKNPYRRNQFGATLGGPIRKDKTFFFTNYEALLSRLTTTSIGNVPTVAARNGGTDGTSGFKVYDPWDNETAISPGVQALLTLYPLPNGEDYGNGIAKHIFPNYQPVNQHYGLVRFDQALSGKDTFMARYSITDARGFNAFNLPTFRFNKQSRLQGLALKWTRTISNSLVNTASFAFQRSLTIASVDPTTPFPAAALTGNAARGLVGTMNVGSAQGVGLGALSTVGTDPWGPFRGAHNTFPVNDDLIYIRGAHTLKFGGQYVPNQWNWDKGNIAGGLYSFHNLNDFLAGAPFIAVILQDGAQPHWKLRTQQFAWYVEDNWRVTSNFTLTLGLRHEFQAPILTEAHNPPRMGNFKSLSSTNFTVGTPFHNYTKKQFSPRIGISYDPFKDGKTAIRAGFGMFYDFIPFEALSGELVYNLPQPSLQALFGITLLDKQLRGTKENPTMPPIPFPACPPGPNGTSSCTVPSGYPGFVAAVLEPVRPPTSYQWNLQIERELPGRLKVAGTYTGSRTYNIMRTIEGNSSKPCSFDSSGRPYFGPTVGACGTMAPAFGSMAFQVYSELFDGQANYHAGSVSVSRSFGAGLSFATSYTFAKAMSNVDTSNDGAILAGTASHSSDPFNPKHDWSESTMSIRHRFTMNGIFELPFGKGKMWAGNASGLKQALIGGWALNPMLEIRSGFPFSVLAGVGISNAGDAAGLPDRPNILRPNPVLGGVDRYFDPKAYVLQEPGYLGTAPRNSVRGPGFAEVDISLTKKFQTSERTNLEFRAEAFNLINHPNFDLPSNSLYVLPGPMDLDKTTCNLTPAQALTYSCNPTAGQITRTVGTPRQLQLALKFTF